MIGREQLVAILLVAAAIVGGCGGDDQSTKAGGPSPPLSLRIGTDDYPGRVSAASIEEFARRVETLSDGQLLIEPVWHAGGDPSPDDADQVVARMVIAGKLDMGVIPARAWDTEGVTSLRALNAPFLVTSDELVDEIVVGELAGEMLAGLDEIGITGLALLPESLRHVFAWGDPLVSAEDFDGTMIRVPNSDTVYRFFETLGATPADLDGDTLDDAISSGSMAGAESDFGLAGDLAGPRTTAAGNITLFPKVNTLVVNASTFYDLTDDQQATLRAAAAATLDWTLTNRSDDVTRACAFCDAGGTVTTAGDAEVAALEQAAQPVYVELEQDATTALLIERIREMKRQLPAPDSPPPCAPPPATATTATQAVAADPSDDAEFPQGVYRMEITAESMERLGVSESDARDQGGVWTLTFQDGQVTVADIRASDDRHQTGTGTYCVAEDRVTVDMGGDDSACGDDVLFSAAWTVQDGELRFAEIRDGEGVSTVFFDTLWGSRPWEKIG